jgi:hypothetical protein
MNEIELYDIYDIWYEPSWFIRYKTELLIALISAIFLSMAFYWYKKKLLRRKKCWEFTLDKLVALNRLISQDHKLFYFNLTAIIKDYLIERYALDMRSKTDFEMVEYFKNNNLLPEVSEDLRKIFSGTTLVKFANGKVDNSILKNDLNITIAMVKNTIPKNGKSTLAT